MFVSILSFFLSLSVPLLTHTNAVHSPTHAQSLASLPTSSPPLVSLLPINAPTSAARRGAAVGSEAGAASGDRPLLPPPPHPHPRPPHGRPPPSPPPAPALAAAVPAPHRWYPSPPPTLRPSLLPPSLPPRSAAGECSCYVSIAIGEVKRRGREATTKQQHSHTHRCRRIHPGSPTAINARTACAPGALSAARTAACVAEAGQGKRRCDRKNAWRAGPSLARRREGGDGEECGGCREGGD